MRTSTYHQDYKYGITKENELFNTLKDKFDKDLEKAKNRYNLFDFTSDKTEVELKSRRVKHDQYVDTMIGINKVYYARENKDKDFIFCFNFTDGLYYFKHNNDYEYNIRFGGHPEDRKTYAFIPVKDLLKV